MNECYWCTKLQTSHQASTIVNQLLLEQMSGCRKVHHVGKKTSRRENWRYHGSLVATAYKYSGGSLRRYACDTWSYLITGNFTSSIWPYRARSKMHFRRPDYIRVIVASHWRISADAAERNCSKTHRHGWEVVADLAVLRSKTLWRLAGDPKRTKIVREKVDWFNI